MEWTNTVWFSSAASGLIKGSRALASACSDFNLGLSLTAKPRLDSAPVEEFPDCWPNASLPFRLSLLSERSPASCCFSA